jgi:hypothetical protein
VIDLRRKDPATNIITMTRIIYPLLKEEPSEG